MVNERVHVAKTPNGNRVELIIREDVGDIEVVHAVLGLDEYRLSGLTLEGTAFDIGAHIGCVSVALAVDNPDLRVIAVEPVPENVDLLKRNIALNGVGDRVIVDRRAAGPSLDTGLAVIEYGWPGRNAFVGGLGEGTPTKKVWALPVPLSCLLDQYEVETAALVKVDCEGCEWDVLADPAVDRCERICGEWHGPGGAEQIAQLLARTHTVEAVDYRFFAEPAAHSVTR